LFFQQQAQRGGEYLIAGARNIYRVDVGDFCVPNNRPTGNPDMSMAAIGSVMSAGRMLLRIARHRLVSAIVASLCKTVAIRAVPATSA